LKDPMDFFIRSDLINSSNNKNITFQPEKWFGSTRG